MRMAFHIRNCVGTRDDRSFAVQWLACTLPCRRFAGVLTDVCARLGADADRYSFTVRDSHPLLLVGLPAHSENLHTFGQGPVFLVCPLSAIADMTACRLMIISRAAQNERGRQLRRPPNRAKT